VTTATTTELRRDKRVIVYAWIALTASTLVAWRLTPGHTDASGLDTGLITGVVVLGLIKCRLIIRYFMEVRHAPLWLRITTDAWLAVIWIALLAIYLY